MADDNIKYSDIIQPDDSIEKLIAQLTELNKQYGSVVETIKTGAEKIASSLKSASGATSKGRKEIDEATAAASRLERAEKELEFAMSDVGKEVAWLKAQISSTNKSTVEQRRYIEQISTSYNRLKSDLKQAVSLYKDMSSKQRDNTSEGQALLQTILNLKNEISAIDSKMKNHVKTLDEVQKAEQRLAFLQSDEGKRLIQLKARISELTSARKQQKAIIGPLAQAQEKLAYALSEENVQLKLYSTQISEANRVAQLQAQIAISAEGSYNRLSAQYSLNKIKLNQMSSAEREAADSGKKLEAETKALYQQMIKLQEATGNYRLSVGNYGKVWDGLGFSIVQVVRELPAAAVSLNTFFLGISNNIPMVIDEIIRLRQQNELLRAKGEETISVTGRIIKSLFGWNTALVIILTAMSMFGDELIDWISKLFRAKNAIISTSEALSNIATELESTNDSYGANIVSLKQLQNEWKNLKTIADKKQWIEDNKTEFDNLSIAINDVADAENAFVDNTDTIITALKLRARAAAAQKLAAEQYEKELIARNKAELEELKKQETLKNYEPGSLTPAQYATPGAMAQTRVDDKKLIEKGFDKRIKGLEDEAEAARKTGDAYFELASGYEKFAQEILNAAKISGSGSKNPRDLTDIINRNSISLQKKYEESVTKLMSDEYAKRRKEAADRVQNENNKLREMYRKNIEYVNNVDKKYKQLTDSQKQQIKQQQKWITDTISNNLKLLSLQLQQIEKEQQVSSASIMRGAINSSNASDVAESDEGSGPIITSRINIVQNPDELEQSLAKERKLAEESLNLEYSLVLETNKKLLEEGNEHARSEEEILIEYNRKRLELWSSYDNQILNLRQQNIKDQLELVEKGSDEELNLLLEQNEIARQIALAENAAKPAEQQISTSTINSKFDKSGALIEGSFQLSRFDEQQALEEARFNTEERTDKEITKFRLNQEKARWQEQIRLAEQGSLDWSKLQIEAAKETVKSIDLELSELDDFILNMGKKGLGYTLLESLGFDDDQINALKDSVNIIIEQLQDIVDAEIELAEAAVESAEKRVEAAQKAYDAEVEARNNGYANSVATAKKELIQEQKNQQEKQKLLEKAQKRQDYINSATQASSLITASANLWSAFSSIPIVGPVLAATAIAAMWASFTAAKIKARQVTANSEEYGDGGLEFLEGGSHASGNDIDLGVSNRRKRRMRAEGGEALAIINKKRTRQYKKILPDVIDSFNKGTFEDKYANAFAGPTELNVMYEHRDNSLNLKRIENDVRSIKKQNEYKYYTLPDGSLVIQHRNVKRIIRK